LCFIKSIPGEVGLADAALEAVGVVDVAVAADDLPLDLLVALLALHLVPVQLLPEVEELVITTRGYNSLAHHSSQYLCYGGKRKKGIFY
jgi:hypothetical protein